MASMKGSRTLENLAKAFAGESQARNRYTFAAAIARKEGYRQIEAIFIETADNEREHGKRFYKAAVEGLGAAEPVMVDVQAQYPFSLGNTVQNLKAAAAGENEEHTLLYPDFAKQAEAEGFKDVAALFRMIAAVEVEHEKRFLKLAANIEKGEVFKRGQKTRWKCRNCGYVHEGDTAPGKCPACAHPQEHFELLAENY